MDIDKLTAFLAAWGKSMELRLLRSFVVLAEELHFGRAAERLCIVQPALSMQIRTLEDELGVVLFDRDRHRVELSAAGRVFLPEAQATLDQARHAVQRVRAAEAGEIGVIRLGFVSSVLPAYLPRLIRALRARHPGIQLELKDMPTPDQLGALKANLIDFGFVRLPVDDKRVTTQTVLEEPYLVVLPAGHALCALSEVTPPDLAAHPVFFLARRFAPGFYDEFMLAMRFCGAPLAVIQELGEFTTMLALVAAGMGIGVVPQLAMAAKPENVEIRPLRLPECLSRVGAAWTDLDTPIKRVFSGFLGRTDADLPGNCD